VEAPAAFAAQIQPKLAFDEQPIQARTVEAASVPEDLNDRRFADGTNLLTWSIKNNKIDSLKKFLASESINPNQPDGNGTRPLFAAIDKGNYEMVQILMRCERIDIGLANGDNRTIQQIMAVKSTYDPAIAPLLTNTFALNIQGAKHQNQASAMDLVSARRLAQLAALFPLSSPEINNLDAICENHSFLKSVFQDGLACPDPIWAILERSWGLIADQQPAYLKKPIEDLTMAIHSGAIADAQQIVDAITSNQPVSFIIDTSFNNQFMNHIMSISIYNDTLIFTNLGGAMHLVTGEADEHNPLAGKRIIQFSDKNDLTADFIRSLQLAEDRALEKIFAMPVVGFIHYKGQKRGNCAGTHPKSIWEDRLLFTQAQQIDPENPTRAIQALFQDGQQRFQLIEIFNQIILPEIGANEPIQTLDEANKIIDTYADQFEADYVDQIKTMIKQLQAIQSPVILHQDLTQSAFKPAYQTFKALTLEARRQTLRDFQADTNRDSFLATQLQLAQPKAYSDYTAEMTAQAINNQIIQEAQQTIERMEQNRLEGD